MQFFMLRKAGFSMTIAFTDTLINNGLLVLIALLLITILQHYRPQKNRYLNLLVWCTVLSLTWRAIVGLTLGNIFEDSLSADGTNYSDYLDASMVYRFNIAFLVCSCASLLALFYLNNQEKLEN
jgi:uncharacterized membrane-anchored protein